jgi:PAS domain S-box-containing protein
MMKSIKKGRLQVNKLGITAKLTLIFVLFAVAVLAALAIPVYVNAQNALKASTYSELLSTALEKQSTLDSWVADRQHFIGEIAHQPSLEASIIAFMAAAPGSVGANISHAEIVDGLGNWAGESHWFLSMEVIDAVNGQVIASTAPGNEGKFRDDQLFFTNGLIAAYVQNPYYDLALQRPVMTASAQIISPDGKVVAVLAGLLNMDEMNMIIQHRSGLHQTDDAFLVNSSNLFVTQPRLNPDPAVLQRGVHTDAINSCLAHNSGVVSAPDYRDVLAFIVYRWLPDRQLCLVVKMDQSEALASTRALATTMALIAGGVFLLGSILAFALSRAIVNPVSQLVDGAVKIGQGDLEARIEVKSKDELGRLGIAFNEMAAALSDKEVQLREYSIQLEHKVEERTAALQLEITERKRTEEDLLIKNQVFEDAAIAQSITDPAAVINACNPEFSRMWGYVTQKQVVGQRFDSFLANPEEADLILEGLGKEGVWKGEYLAKRADETTFMTRAFITRLLNPEGQLIGYQATNLDVTKEKDADALINKMVLDLEHSNQELERFAYVASHDLQEPLRMVTNYMQLLERRYKEKLDGDALEFINFAVDGSNRMKTLINDLLAYSRVGTHGKEFVSIDCEEILGIVLNTLQMSIKDNKGKVTHDPLPTVMGDGTQLESLFQNLIGNALKFHGNKNPRIHVGIRQEGKNWVFSISDNGIGIDPQYFDRIFIIFQRLHNREEYPGTGIGLAVSKRIVERHGGRMRIESQPGRGSTFFFTLPIQGEIR